MYEIDLHARMKARADALWEKRREPQIPRGEGGDGASPAASRTPAITTVGVSDVLDPFTLRWRDSDSEEREMGEENPAIAVSDVHKRGLSGDSLSSRYFVNFGDKNPSQSWTKCMPWHSPQKSG